jgi:cysteine desulfurase family protein (TIGR01976 family)
MDARRHTDIRSQFPALERRHNGLPVAYFDAPGGTQVPRPVAEAMTDYLFHHNANTHWAYPSSEETDAIISGARAAAGEFLHCAPDEIAFGANMTTLTFHLARALGRTWKVGDEVIVTDLDHHGNVAPWRALEVDRGVVVRSARMIRETAQLDYAHLEQLASRKTRLIAIGGASNAVGTINDLDRAKSIADSVDAMLFVDAVHLAPHAQIDVQRIGCDFLACSAYKFYGPHIGILYARRDLLESLPFPRLEPAPDTAPERAETGTQNQEGIAGVTAALEFMASVGAPAPGRAAAAEGGRPYTQSYGTLHEQGQRQIRMLWDGLSRMRGVRLYGPPPTQPRTPTIGFTIDGQTSEQVARALAARALFLSHGDFYAATLIRELGVEGLVRVGFACYTTDNEVMRLLGELEQMVQRKH